VGLASPASETIERGFFELISDSSAATNAVTGKNPLFSLIFHHKQYIRAVVAQALNCANVENCIVACEDLANSFHFARASPLSQQGYYSSPQIFEVKELWISSDPLNQS
jgi:hypothetical protein